MTVDASKKCAEKNYFFIAGVEQTRTDTVEMLVEVSQSAENQPIQDPAIPSLEHIPKGAYTLLERYLLLHVHCFSVHNRQKMKTS